MKPKRSLGQNFFVNTTLAQKIVELTTETSPELIIEIGPGTGSFTHLLETKCKKLVCIEKDDAFAESLKLFYKGATIIHEDVLNTDFHKIIKESGISPEKTVVFGSLPYNISKPIIDKMLTTSGVQNHYYIIQKEVAEKYCAKVQDYNYLAVATQVIATPKILLTISPQSFRPSPKVMSSFIRFISTTTNAEMPIFKSEAEYEKFKDFIHRCFTKPNKTLKNNLGPAICLKIPEAEQVMLSKRPFALTKEELVILFKSIY